MRDLGTLLKVEDLRKVYVTGGKTVYALNGISFSVAPGEAVGLVGESGCGKTTAARCILRLTVPTAGRIEFDGQEIATLPERRLRPFRRRIQMVFQDPTLSLNPRFTVRRTLLEPLRLHGLLRRGESPDARLRRVMEQVSLDPALLDYYPRQLSGGQRQRVGIARAIMTEPELVVLDEPTSALDMSVKLHIVDLLRRLRQELGVAYILITHDLSTVRHLCSRVMVMYLGHIVESGPVKAVFSAPAHPYTRSLLSAVPIPDPERKRERIRLMGETPSPTVQRPGCPLQDRCPEVLPRCRTEFPAYRNLGSEHVVACHLVGEAAP